MVLLRPSPTQRHPLRPFRSPPATKACCSTRSLQEPTPSLPGVAPSRMQQHYNPHNRSSLTRLTVRTRCTYPLATLPLVRPPRLCGSTQRARSRTSKKWSSRLQQPRLRRPLRLSTPTTHPQSCREPTTTPCAAVLVMRFSPSPLVARPTPKALTMRSWWQTASGPSTCRPSA